MLLLPSRCSCSCSFVIANASANVNQMRQCDQNIAVAAASSSWTETAQAEMIDEANRAGTDAAFPPLQERPSYCGSIGVCVWRKSMYGVNRRRHVSSMILEQQGESKSQID